MNSNITGTPFSLSLSNIRHYLLLFLLWPFMAFIIAIINYGKKEARFVVYMFLVYYGLTFVNTNIHVDAYRYALNLKINAILPFSYFFRIVGGLNSDTTVDIIEPLISFIISRFTSSANIYFGVWASIFAFFYLRSVNLLHNRYIKNPGWNAMVFMIFFIFILPITSISGVRMWTAAWIFFLGAYHVVLHRDPRFFILTLAAALLHWSFFSANVILLIYFFAGNRNAIYIPVALASFVVPFLISPLLKSVSTSLGGAVQNRFENYSSEGYVLAQQQSAEQSAWFLKIGSDLVFYYLLLTIIFIQLRFGRGMKEKEERNLFSFLLLFLSFVNFGMPIPSFGERFQVLFFMFAVLYIFLYYIKLPGKKIYVPTIIGIFPMILYVAINLRIGSESINAWIFTPGLGVPLLTPVLSLSEMIFK